MKKICKKVINYLITASLIFNNIIPLLPLMKVKADSLDYVDILEGIDSSGNINLVLGSGETIIRSKNDDYTVSYCSNYSYNDLFVATYEENECHLKANQYGIGNISIGFTHKNGEEYSSLSENFTVIVDPDTYLNLAIDIIPDVIYAKRNINFHDEINSKLNLLSGFYWELKNCENTVNGEKCNLIIFATENPTYKREKQVELFYSDLSFSENPVEIEINQSRQLFINNFAGNYDNLIWSSDDISTVSVDQKGNIKGLKAGTATITVYDKTTNLKASTNIKVGAIISNDLQSFLDIFTGEIIIDASSNYFHYDSFKEEVNIENTIKYLLINKFNEMKVTNTWFDYVEGYPDVTFTTLDNGICEATIGLYVNGQKRNYNLEFTYKITGFLIYDLYMSEGNQQPLNYISFFESSITPTVEINEDYLEKIIQDDQIFIKAKKVSTSKISLIVDDYVATANVIVSLNYNVVEEGTEYLKSKSNITLPYSQSDFTTPNGLRTLENIIAEKLFLEYPNDELKPYLSVNAGCLTANMCTVSLLYSSGNNTQRTPYRLITIDYSDESSDAMEVINDINSSIGNKYYYNFDETVKIEEKCSGDKTCFYDTILDDLNIDSFLKNNVTIGNIATTRVEYSNFINGSLKVKINFLENGVSFYTKEFEIITNHILSLDNIKKVNIEQHRNYLIEYINTLMERSTTTATHINNNIFCINDNYNVIVDQKELVYATNIEFNNRAFVVNVGETKQPQYSFYPHEANFINVTFSSDNEDIALVDADTGEITGVNKGFTFITAKLETQWGHSSNKLLVLVNMTIQEYISEIAEFIPLSVTINYGDLRYNPITSLISGKLSTEFYKMNFYSTNFEVKEIDGKYFARIYFYTNYEYIHSDYYEIDYKLEGIKVDKQRYDLSVGESVETNLLFTEGDNTNLTFYINDDSVVDFSIDGKITALKPGITDIYIYDKLYNYYNSIQVSVDIEDYIAELQNLFTEKTYDLNASFIYSYGYNQQGISNLLLNKVNNELKIWNILSGDATCNYQDEYCNYEINLEINDVPKTYPINIKYNLDGLMVNSGSKIREISLNEEIIPEVEYYGEDDSPLEISSLNPDICTINGEKIKGIKSGACDIEYKKGESITHLYIIVDINGIYEKYNEVFENLDETIVIKSIPMDLAEIKEAQEIGDYEKTDLLYFAIERAIKESMKEIEIFNDIKIDFSFESLLETGELVLSIAPMQIFIDELTNLYIDYSTEFTEERTFQFEFVEVDENIIEASREVADKIQKIYNLTALQYIEYLLNNGQMRDIYKYSDVMNILEGYPEFDILYQEQGGMGDENFFATGGQILITYNGIVVASSFSEFFVKVEIAKEENQSEEEFIEEIKYLVSDAYVSAKEKLENPLRRMMSLMSTEVPVEVSFFATGSSAGYLVDVENLSFTLALGGQEGIYEVSATDIILNRTEVELNIDQRFVLTAEIKPDNATNKDVLWTSSDNSVVTVNNGELIAVGKGSAVITIKSGDGKITKTVNVTVKGDTTPGGAIKKVGDVNQDGLVNMADLVKIRRYFAGLDILTEQGFKNADVNNDGSVNIADLIKMRKVFAGLESF